jgi:undecaprenyldiphospho-muramoylpentapeptide beta-N-acetylglucosaminyltransferase
VYPALAVLQALTARHSDLETLWVGGEGGMEAELVKRAGVAFRSVPAAGLHGVGLAALPRNLSLLTRGVLASRKILRDFRPDALFLTGGYVAGPMAYSGRGVPTLLYVPDIEPGLALKSMARFARRIAVSAEDSRRYFDRDVIVTGYPVRNDLAKWNREKGRGALNLEADGPVLLVVGGSKGARSINEGILPQLPAWLELTQVLHVTGQLDWQAADKARNGLSTAQLKRYQAFPYLHENMGAALAAADLVVARAGASTLGEFPLFGLPAVLVPYPHAWRYQKVNADYLSRRGAAVIVEDRVLERQLLPVVKDLLENPSKRRAMRTAMRSVARPTAADDIGQLLLELGGQQS